MGTMTLNSMYVNHASEYILGTISTLIFQTFNLGLSKNRSDLENIYLGASQDGPLSLCEIAYSIEPTYTCASYRMHSVNSLMRYQVDT